MLNGQELGMEPGGRAGMLVLRLVESGVGEHADPGPSGQRVIGQIVQLVLGTHQNAFAASHPGDFVQGRAPDERRNRQHVVAIGHRPPEPIPRVTPIHAENVEPDRVIEKPVGGRETGPGDLVGQRFHPVGKGRRRSFRAEFRQAPDEIRKRAARGSPLPWPGRRFARQRDVPRTVEGEVPRQDGDAQQGRPVFRLETKHPDLGMKRPASRRAHGMHARFQQCVQLASLARDCDAGAIHEDVNSFSLPAQRLKEQQRVGEECLEPVVRAGDKAQR